MKITEVGFSELKPIATALLGVYLLAALTDSSNTQERRDPSDRTASGGAQERLKDEPPEKLLPGARCSDCHADVADQAHIHRPIRLGKCNLCHIQQGMDLHIFESPKDMGKVCGQCHFLPPRTSFHAPVRDGDCLVCHVPHQSNERLLLRVPTERQLCGQCHHAQLGIDSKHVHGPAAAGACLLCHEAHSSPEPHLLRTGGSASCLSCHIEMNAILEAPNIVHTPVREDCVGCHDAHASEHRFQLKAEAKRLCMDCHVPLLERIENAPVVHEALRTEEGCVHCHEAHSSPYPNMLKQPIGQLCLSCHDAAIKREDGTSLPGIGEKMRASTHLHGPLVDGNCAACHDPHASMTFSLLRKPYPREFYSAYATENYQLCFGCHDSSSMETEFTETHTGFRDGNQNLHFVHVNDKQKGRTCRACHDHHASNQPRQMTASVPFGNWELPIGFTETPTGGACAPGCHLPREYDRLEPKGSRTGNALDLLIQEGATR